MSINGPVRVSSQPNWPPSSSHTNMASGKENLLSKTILEGNTSSSPSSLIAKKVEKEEIVLLKEMTNDFISTYFRFKRTRKNLEITKTQIADYVKKLNEKPADLKVEMSLRFCLVNCILIRSAFCSVSAREPCLEDAAGQVAYMQKVAYFNPFTQMAAYLLKVLDGINCLDMKIVRDILLNLKRANLVSSENAGATELREAETFFKTRWKELKDEGSLSEELYDELNESLAQIMTEDPFKDEFIKNPELFKKIESAPEVLLKKYPHLKSVNDFLSKYPEAGIISLRNQTYNLQNLKYALSDAEANPLTRSIHLLTEEPVITSTAAKLIRDFMLKHPKVKVCLGDEADGKELAKSFFEDTTLTQNRGALVCSKDIVIRQNRPVYSYMINPQNPFVKKPEPVLASSQNTTGLVDGHVFFILTRESGKKALAVKECEVDSVKKIKNRSYVDENGVTQEYDIVVFGPELYEKLDKITGNIHQKYSLGKS